MPKRNNLHIIKCSASAYCEKCNFGHSLNKWTICFFRKTIISNLLLTWNCVVFSFFLQTFLEKLKNFLTFFCLFMSIWVIISMCSTYYCFFPNYFCGILLWSNEFQGYILLGEFKWKLPWEIFFEILDLSSPNTRQKYL